MKKTKKNNWKSGRKADFRTISILLACGCILAAGAFAWEKFVPETEVSAADTSIEISEVMTSNRSMFPSPDGSYTDWIELHNTTGEPVSLSGRKLSLSIDLRGGLELPDATVEPYGYYVLWDPGIKLSSSSFPLFLTDAENRLAQSLTVPAMKNTESYACASDGSWDTTDMPTPGRENTKEAFSALTAYPGDTSPVIFNELMAVNRTTFADGDGDMSDWLELYNTGSEAVDLTGWSLTTNLKDRRKWVFPETSLGAGEYLVVFCSGKDRTDGELHASFRLSGDGETLYLLNAGGIPVSRITYGRLGKDISYSRTDSGTYSTEIEPSPGSVNSLEGSMESRGTTWRSADENPEQLYINEIAASVSGSPDWVEIYNGSSQAVDLSGWWLSDEENDPCKWQFPANTEIKADGYYVVCLDGKESTRSEVNGAPCAKFSLELAKEETVCLSKPDGTLVDSVLLRDQVRDVSYGRANGQRNYRYFSTMTPGKANDKTSYADCAGSISFSHPGGRVGSDTYELTISAKEGYTVYYTTNSRKPDSDSHVYNGPITLTSNTMVRAIAVKKDCLSSEELMATFILGDTGTLRTVCITGSSSKLNNSGGVLRTGNKKEVPVYVEIYDYDNTLMISQRCELSITGRSSRLTYDQKSFHITAKSKYGDSKFRASLFTKRDYTKYNAVIFRMSGQDCTSTHMRDSIITGLAEDLNIYYQETELSAVYINGKYWGMYNMREHIDPDSLCQFHGWEGDEDKIDLLEGKNAGRVQGSSDTYWEMMSFLKRNNLSSASGLAKLRTYCDVENYLDYAALQIYCANQDLGNIRIYRNKNKDGLWRWIPYDLDLSYMIDQNSFAMWMSGSGETGSITQQSNLLFRRLMNNAEMKDYFLTRFGQLLATTFSPQNVLEKIQTRRNLIANEMKRNCKRWGWTTKQWTKYGQRMMKYAATRPEKLIGYAKQTFKLSNEQVQHYFGDAIAKIQDYKANGLVIEEDEDDTEADVEAPVDAEPAADEEDEDLDL